MPIAFRDFKDLTCEQISDLFLSVGWESGKYPDKLKIALANSHSVYTAWDGDKLVGLINAMSDGIINVYFQYLLVRPDYQEKGIGKKLVNLMLERYKAYLRKALIAYNTAVGFYKSCGFEAGDDKTPIIISVI